MHFKEFDRKFDRNTYFKRKYSFKCRFNYNVNDMVDKIIAG